MRAALLFVLAIVLFSLHQAHAHFYESADEDAWMASLMQPDTAVSCCGGNDAFWADRVEECTVADPPACALIAYVTDDRQIKGRPDMNGRRLIVPRNKIRKAANITPNPTGHNVIFANPQGWVYCWEPLALL